MTLVEKIARALASHHFDMAGNDDDWRWHVVERRWQSYVPQAVVMLKAQREAIEDMQQPTIHYAVMKQWLDAAILEATSEEIQ